MAGIFKFHPRTSASALECNLGDQENIPYYIVIPVDWRESERERAIAGVSDEFFPPSEYENVEIELTVAIGGSTEAETYQNFLTFDTELRRYKGGVIEYKPIEFPDGIRSTFYHYEYISAPRRVDGALSVPSSGYKIATGYVYSIWIKPWATSDPYNLTEIVSSEVVSNGGSYSFSNTLITSPIMFPRIRLDEVTGGGEPDFAKVYMHIRPHTIGNSNTNDLAPQQQNGPSGWTSPSDARALGGSVSRSPSGTDVYWSQLFDPSVLSTIDWSWFGYGTPVISCFPTSASAVWNVRPYVSERGLRDIISYGDWAEITGSYRGPHFFQDLPIPPGGQVPSYISQSTTPDIDLYMTGSSDLRFGFEFQRISGTGSIDVDFIGLLNGNNSWQAKIFNVDESQIGGGYEVWIDPFGGTIHEVWVLSTNFYQTGWSKIGDPIKSLVLRRGYDYVFNFLIETDSDGFHADAGVLLSVDALHGTMHPFST